MKKTTVNSLLRISCLLALVLCGSTAFAASPQLTIITPRGVQRGTEAELTLHGRRLTDAQELLIYEKGITVLSVEPDEKDEKKAKVKIKVDAGARLGSYTVRVRTKSGLSEARTLSVGQYPVVNEKEPNDDFSAPQQIAMNTTVHGVADNEDVDHYIVTAKKGERITAEVEAMRLGSYNVDAYVAIMDMKRFELAASDDSSLALQDPVASVIAPEDGTYIIQVRESSYAGNGNSRYCVHIGNAPRPMVAYPAGGKAGEEIEVRLIGDVSGDIKQKIKLPEKAGDFEYFTVQGDQSSPSANIFRVSAFGNVLEAEPNNDATTATKTDSEVPLAFNGIIEQDGDIDYFRFKAKKGQQFDVRAVARGVRSPLDPVLTIHNDKGAQIAANDDSGGPDSYIKWSVPEDGEYCVAVRDHLSKGARDFVYRIEFTPISSQVTLAIPSYARNSQDRNTVVIPRGNRYATILRVGRENFGGDVIVSAPELPPGVVMNADMVSGTVTEVPVVFEAAADAPIGGTLMHLLGAHATDKSITGGFQQTIELIYGQPNNTIFFKSEVNRVATSVAEEAPFKIDFIEPKVPLVRSGSMNIKVVVKRAEGFDKPIKVRMLWNPPGVGSQNEITIPQGQTEAMYPINASGSAPTRTWKIAMTAVADEGEGAVWTSSQLGSLIVAEPMVGMTIDMVAGEQGKTAQILCKITTVTPFEGKATVTLYGFPPKVTVAAPTKEITKDDTTLVFEADVAADAPVGQHKTLFGQIVITKDGEPIAHNLAGGSVFRIDAPPKPKPNQPAAPAPAPAPTPVAQAPEKKPEQAPPPKVLSRLEKLRLEAEERAKQNQ